MIIYLAMVGGQHWKFWWTEDCGTNNGEPVKQPKICAN